MIKLTKEERECLTDPTIKPSPDAVSQLVRRGLAKRDGNLTAYGEHAQEVAMLAETINAKMIGDLLTMSEGNKLPSVSTLLITRNLVHVPQAGDGYAITDLGREVLAMRQDIGKDRADDVYDEERRTQLISVAMPRLEWERACTWLNAVISDLSTELEATDDREKKRSLRNRIRALSTLDLAIEKRLSD